MQHLEYEAQNTQYKADLAGGLPSNPGKHVLTAHHPTFSIWHWHGDPQGCEIIT